MGRSGTVWIAALLAGCALAPAAYAERARTPPAAAPAVKFRFDRFTLPNGLTVLVYTDRSVPTVYVGVRYRTGSRDEPAGRSGFAHLFEHLMFTPTAHRDGEFFAPLQRAGATDMNGSTDLDHTSYFETVPSSALDLALWLESDRMGYLDGGITQARLDEQRAVVKNEKRQGELQPGGGVQARFQASFYPPGHPYAHTTIGSMEDLDRASLDDVKGWFRDRYGAGNAVLVLAGDIDPAAAREKVTRYFGAIRAGTPADRPLQWVPELTHVRREVMYDRFDAPSLSRTWPLPNDDPRATTLLLLAARALAGAGHTPLQRALVGERRVATGVTAQVTENALASTFTIGMTLRPGVAPEAAGRALDAALAETFARGLDPERLKTVVAATDVAVLRTLESNAAVADFMIGGEIEHGDPAYFLKQRGWIGTATAAEVGAELRKRLDRPYQEMQLLPLPPAALAVRDVDRTRPPEPAAFDGTIAFPPITETRLANGMKLVVAQRPRTPMVDMTMRFATGARADRGYAPGAAAAAFGLLLSGSRDEDATMLARRSSRLGAGIGSTPGDTASAVTWSATPQRLDETFALAADVLRRPTYPASAVDAVAATARPAGTDPSPTAAAGVIFAQLVWGRPDPAATPKAAATPLTRDAIVRFHAREIGPNDATLYMIGDVAPAEAKRLAERHFGDWRPVTPTPLDAAVTELLPAKPPGRIVLLDAPGAAQSSIVLGNLTLPFDAARSAGESLVDAALGGGFDSRLNRNLRGKGWSYGFTGGIADRPRGARLFAASGTVQTDRTAQSMAELRREIADFTTTRPIAAEELESVRAAAVHSVPLGYTGNGDFLNAVVTSASYGLPYDHAASATRRLAAVTLEDARRIAAQLYRADTLTWVVVGDLRLIEADVRALGFAPVEVWDAQGRRVR